MTDEVTQHRINALLDSNRDLQRRLEATVAELRILERERDMALLERDQAWDRLQMAREDRQ